MSRLNLSCPDSRLHCKLAACQKGITHFLILSRMCIPSHSWDQAIPVSMRHRSNRHWMICCGHSLRCNCRYRPSFPPVLYSIHKACPGLCLGQNQLSNAILSPHKVQLMHLHHNLTSHHKQDPALPLTPSRPPLQHHLHCLFWQTLLLLVLETCL